MNQTIDNLRQEYGSVTLLIEAAPATGLGELYRTERKIRGTNLRQLIVTRGDLEKPEVQRQIKFVHDVI